MLGLEKLMAKNKIKKTKNDNLDPDVRFLLANERTLLAWVRTSLAVIAGGFVLIQISDDSTTQSIIGFAAVGLGIFMVLVGYVRFRDADKAIRAGKLPETARASLIQISGIIGIALILVTTHLMGVW